MIQGRMHQQAIAVLPIPEASGDATPIQIKHDSSNDALYQLDPSDTVKTVTSIRNILLFWMHHPPIETVGIPLYHNK